MILRLIINSVSRHYTLKRGVREVSNNINSKVYTCGYNKIIAAPTDFSLQAGREGSENLLSVMGDILSQQER